LYLKPYLEQAFEKRVLSVFGNLSAGTLKAIYENFDASYKDQKNDYDILLTTDKISEGFNLNRAGMVINYDIPWNPVRVIQRVGRINRINKKVFDRLYIVNFFPTEKGADIVKSRQIATNKMFMIHNTLGEDAKIFDIDEEPTPSGLYNKIQQNPEELEGESFLTKIIKEYEMIKSKYPQLVDKIKDYPIRIKVAKKGEENELIVVIKKGRVYIHHKRYDQKENNHNIVSLEEVIDKIRAKPEEKALTLSDNFWQAYDEIKNYKERIFSKTSEISLEQRAKNVLNSLLRINNNEKLTNLKPFIRTLLEDIIDFGTLSDFTLRRIANIDIGKKPEKEIEEIKKELGQDYLQKEKQRLKDLKKEIIVAIENIRFGRGDITR
jgi:superfamily II DNA/RNA helicase